MARNFSIVFCSRGSLSLFGVIFLFLVLFRFGLGFLALDSGSGAPDRGCAAGELMKKRFLDVHPVEEMVVVLAEDALRVCKTTARRCDGLPEGEGKEHGTGAATTSALVSRFVWVYPMSLYKRLFCIQQQQQSRLLLVEKKVTVAVCEEVKQVLAEVNASSEKLFEVMLPTQCPVRLKDLE